MDELRRIRKERGLSQQRLAELAKVDKVTIVHIENGKVSPKVETLGKLAGALEIELADLFPKAQAPLPDLEEARRSPAFADAMIALSELWMAQASDPEFAARKVGGLINAALDLGDVVAERVVDLWNALPPAEQRKVIEIMQKTNDVAKRGLERLQEEEDAAEFKRRREKIRERTRQIRQWSASA